MKKVSALLALALAFTVLLGACGFGGGQQTGETAPESSGIELEDGRILFNMGDFSVILPGGYQEQESKTFTYSFTGGEEPVVLDILKEPYESFPDATFGMSLTDYAITVMDRYDSSARLDTDAMGNRYFAYTERVDDVNYFYFTVLKQGGGAFWTCRFKAPGSKAGFLLEQFGLWASEISVGFDTRFVPEGMQLLEEENIALILPADFSRSEGFSDVDYFYQGSETQALLYLIRQPYAELDFRDLNAATPALDYASAMAAAHHPDAEVYTDERGNACYVYTSDNGLVYWTAVKKAPDSFWLCRFVCAAELYEGYQESSSQWAGSIEAG